MKFNVVEIVILIVFAVSFFVQIFYYLYFHLRVVRYKPPEHKIKTKKLPVSVIICARNEEHNLRVFLPKILEQDYPDFEVVLVNDRSNDNTAAVLQEMKSKYSNLYVTTIPLSANKSFNKKLAINIGLKAAKHDYVLFTDADCKPVSNEWISSMQSHFDRDTDFVIGYGAYASSKGLLNKIIRYDTLCIALNYMSFALAGVPYMGVGRNMAYRKSIYFEGKGFSQHLNIASGDDDLFINENANKNNLKVVLNPASFTVSPAKQTFKQWFKQKKRHLCTGKYYKRKHKYLLGLQNASLFLFYLSFIVSLFFNNLLFIALGAFVIRYALNTLILYYTSLKFKEKSVYFFSLFFDILIPLVNFVIFFRNRKSCEQAQ